MRSSIFLILLTLLAAPVQAQTMYYAHTDLTGSVVAVTDQDRNVVERRVYEPYGLSQTAIPDGPGFTGHDHDGDTGLMYMQQRHYDPMTGIFLSVDPVGVSQASGANFNRYHYAANNPYRFVDPDGRMIRQWDCLPVSDCHGSGGSMGSIKGPQLEGCRQTCFGGDSGGQASSEDVGISEFAELAGMRADDMFDASISFGVQAGFKGKAGPLASLGGELSLFALEWDGGLNYQGVSQGGGLTFGMVGFGEGTVSRTRRGPGAPDGPWKTTKQYTGFSQNAEGDFILGASLPLFIGISLEVNITKTIAPFIEASQ